MSNILRQLCVSGPTVADDINRLISKYGSEAVQQAVANATKKRRGRKPEQDWPLLAPIISQDAVDWLEGRNPFKLRTNYRVAKDFAEKYPGQSVISTQARIERKLTQHRYWRMLSCAYIIARDGYPYAQYIESLKALHDYQGSNSMWEAICQWDIQKIDEYRAIFGEPDIAMTFSEIEIAVRLKPKILPPQPKWSELGTGILSRYQGLISNEPS